MFLLKDYNANKKSIQKELFVFLQAIEDSSGLKILVQYELEEAQRNQNKKKSTYKETSDIYSEWWQKKNGRKFTRLQELRAAVGCVEVWNMTVRSTKKKLNGLLGNQ